MSPVLRLLLLSVLVLGFGNGCAGPGTGAPVEPSVDLTRRPWFPPLVAQQGFSCSQQVASYYLFTSEWNRTAGRASSSPWQRFSPYYTYSMVAGESTGSSHVVDGWIVGREAGLPLEADFPRYSRTLMHGYDRYHRAMRHRVADWEVIRLTDAAGIQRACSLLAAGRPLACNFQVRGATLVTIPPGQPRAGEKIVTRWGPSGQGHAMVYAGYDANAGFDFNRDGRLTNDLDLNGDGSVTPADWERGAFLVLNPWGGRWGDRGRAWVPWRHHAASGWIWAREVAAVTPAPPVSPRLTLKLRLRAADRQAVLVTAGDGRTTVEPWMFSHRPAQHSRSASVWECASALWAPGPHLSPGPLAAPGGGPLETGHDLSALSPTGRYTLAIRPAPGRSLSGELSSASFLEYDSFGRLLREVPIPGLPAPLPPGGAQWETR